MSQRRLMAAISISLFVVGLDSSVVNILLPKITTDLQIDMATAASLGTVYLTVLAALSLPFGRCADLFRATRIFSIGNLLFGLGSLGCGLSESFTHVLIGRGLQGVGGALLSASMGAVVLQNIDKSKVGGALGQAMAVMSLGSLVGPPVGGFFAQHSTWQWAFLVNVPLCLVSFLLLFSYPSEAPAQEKPITWRTFDPWGALCMAVVMISLPAALHSIGSNQAKSYETAAFFLVGLIFTGLLWFQESRASQPLLKPHLFLARDVGVWTVIKLALFLVLNGVMLVFPFYLSSLPKLSHSAVGWIMLAPAVAIGLVTPLAGKLSDKFGSKILLFGGASSLVLSVLAALTLTNDPSLPILILILAAIGGSIAVVLVVSTVGFLSLAPPEETGVFSAVNSLLAPLGGSVGFALFSSLYSDGQGAGQNLAGFHTSVGAMIFCAAVLWIFGFFAPQASKTEDQNPNG